MFSEKNIQFYKSNEENCEKLSIDISANNSFESPKTIRTKDFMSPKASFESLQRLYSKGNNENIIEKIIKCRNEFTNRNTLLMAFKSIVHPIAKDAVFCLKQYCFSKKMKDAYNNSIKLVFVIQSLFSKRKALKFFVWKRA